MKSASIRPITELKNHTKDLVQEVAEGGGSVVITQNGKPRVVMMAAIEHDRLQQTLVMLKLLAHSQDAARAGRVFSTSEARRRVKHVLAKARRR